MLVNVRDEGAVGDGQTNDTAAIVAADSKAVNGTISLPPGRYLVDEDNVDILKASRVLGEQATILGGLNIKRDNVLIEGLEFENIKPASSVHPTAGVVSTGHNDIKVERCIFNKTRLQVQDARRFIFEHNKVTGDYSDYSDAVNILWCLGVEGCWIEGNDFDFSNPYRLAKIETGTNKSDGVFVSKNQILCNAFTSGKQLFDFYSAANRVVVEGNVIDIAGNCSTLFEQKAAGSAGFNDWSHMIISGNIAVGGFQRFALCQGLYGSAEVAGFQKATISNNDIQCGLAAASNPQSAIDVRGLWSAVVVGNDISYPSLEPSFELRAILAASLGSLSVVSNNIEKGSIACLQDNGSGILYTKCVERANVSGNVLVDYSYYAGLFVNAPLAGDIYTVEGNTFRTSNQSAKDSGFVRINGGAAETVIILGNAGSETSGYASPVVNTAVTGKLVDADNSWN